MNDEEKIKKKVTNLSKLLKQPGHPVSKDALSEPAVL